MQLKFINIEDAEENSLRIRLSDLRANGFVKFKTGVYADPIPEFAFEKYVPTEEEEKQTWVLAASKIKDIYGGLETTEMEQSIRDEFSAGIVAIEFDHESGELTLKENQPCQSSTKANTSTQAVSSKPKISIKTKPKPSSKSSRKSTRR